MGDYAAKESSQTHTPSVESPLLSSGKASADKLLNQKDAPSLSNASYEEVKKTLEVYTNGIFDNLDKALKAVIPALVEPIVPPEPSLAEKMLTGLVGSIAEMAMNYVSFGLVSKVEHIFGATLTEAVKEGTKSIALKAGGGIEKFAEKAIGNRSEAAETEGGEKKRKNEKLAMANPSAKKWLEEYQTKQETALTARRSNAIVAGIVEPLCAGSNQQILQLSHELAAIVGDERLGSHFQTSIAVGWLNFLTSVSDTDKRAAPKATSAFEAEPHDWNDGEHHLAAGAVTVYLKRENDSFGTVGLKKLAVDAGGSPGTERVLAQSDITFLTTPVLRKVVFRNDEKSALDDDCAIVIYPNGGMTLNLKSQNLSVIGSPIAGQPATESTAKTGAQMLLDWFKDEFEY